MNSILIDCIGIKPYIPHVINALFQWITKTVVFVGIEAVHDKYLVLLVNVNGRFVTIIYELSRSCIGFPVQ